MSEEYFDKVAEKIGFDTFNAEIVDGKFVISPSDAGLMLLAHLEIAEKQLGEREADIFKLQDELELLRLDNSQIRDLLDRCYSVLIEEGHAGLAEEILDVAYKTVGITEMGGTE